MTKLTSVEGIGDTYAKRLADAGVSTQEQLLEACCKPGDRKKLSEASDISPTMISKWANRADLARVKGIGGEYADLLEVAGVDTVPELAQRNADNLHAKLAEINEAKKLVRKLPSATRVQGWVAEAKTLPRKICY